MFSAESVGKSGIGDGEMENGKWREDVEMFPINAELR
jgi:hypothetical protein